MGTCQFHAHILYGKYAFIYLFVLYLMASSIPHIGCHQMIAWFNE